VTGSSLLTVLERSSSKERVTSSVPSENMTPWDKSRMVLPVDKHADQGCIELHWEEMRWVGVSWSIRWFLWILFLVVNWSILFWICVSLISRTGVQYYCSTRYLYWYKLPEAKAWHGRAVLYLSPTGRTELQE
jgi:hypothetical protein